jgi:hypothetical protein
METLTTEPSRISDQERRAKLEALQKARAEKTAHTLEAFVEEAEEEDDEAVDRQLQTMDQKLLILRKREIRKSAGSKKEKLQRNWRSSTRQKNNWKRYKGQLMK